MNKMKLVSWYEDYGNKNMWNNESNVKCVCDRCLYDNQRTGKQVAMLIEPRSIMPDTYEFIMKNYDKYEYVFTHDSILLNKLPNAKPILWGNVWVRDRYPKKSKLISMVCSDKEACELHKERIRIARKYKDKIDVYGTVDGGEYVDPSVPLIEYRYSVVIENYIDDIWFTEKICNCFATRTIPIYYGARCLDNYFNMDGIIECQSINQVENKIDAIINNPEEFKDVYNQENVQKALEENYEKSKEFNCFDEWLYNTYEKEIGGLFE